MPATDVAVLSLVPYASSASRSSASTIALSQPDDRSDRSDTGGPAASACAPAGAPMLDATDFPVVAMCSPAHAGSAFAWGAAMQSLLERRTPFVLLDHALPATPGDAGDAMLESEYRMRRCWVRAHAAALSRYCYGLIVIEADVAQRCEARARALSLVDAAKVRVVVVSGIVVARQLADVLLSAEKPIGALR